MSVLDNWERWKKFLGDKIEIAQQEGISQNVITEVAQQVGEYLAQEVEPKNEQERLLQELWNVASKEEQRAIANLMVKLVQK